MFIGTDTCLEQIKRSFAWYYKQSKRGKSAELLRRKLGLLIIVFAVMSIKFIRLNSELNNQPSKFSEMIKNQIKNTATVFLFTNIIFFGNICYGKDHLLLQCKGSRFIEIDLMTSQKENKFESYEIKSGKLVLRIFGQEKEFEPSENNQNKLSYHIPNDLGHLKKNYHLQFDRISGRIEERYDSFPSKGYWKFEGFCEKTNRKF